MREADVEVILQRAKEKYPEAKPRIISDNGLQFIARDFKEFIRISGMTHVRTSPYYPQSKDYASHCTSSMRCDTTLVRARCDSLMPCAFSRRVLAWWFVQAVVLVVIGMATNQSMPVPYRDLLPADSERCSHFLNGQHARLS